MNFWKNWKSIKLAQTDFICSRNATCRIRAFKVQIIRELLHVFKFSY